MFAFAPKCIVCILEVYQKIDFLPQKTFYKAFLTIYLFINFFIYKYSGKQ